MRGRYSTQRQKSTEGHANRPQSRLLMMGDLFSSTSTSFSQNVSAGVSLEKQICCLDKTKNGNAEQTRKTGCTNFSTAPIASCLLWKSSRLTPSHPRPQQQCKHFAMRRSQALLNATPKFPGGGDAILDELHLFPRVHLNAKSSQLHRVRTNSRKW